MPVPKAVWAWARKNRLWSQTLLRARRGIRSSFRASIPGGNLPTFMGVGAGFGAIRGTLDNLIGIIVK